MSCHHAFLFSFVNPSGLGPNKLSLNPGKEGRGIFCDSSYGPVFGDGNDLWMLKNANTSLLSSSILGNTYQLPPGQQNTFFTGAIDFSVSDYEVFGLRQ